MGVGVTGIPLHTIEGEGEGDMRAVEMRGAMEEVADMTALPPYIERKGVGTGIYPESLAGSSPDTIPGDGRHPHPTMTIDGEEAVVEAEAAMTIGTAYQSSSVKSPNCECFIELSDMSALHLFRRLAPIASRGGREEYTTRSYSRPREEERRSGPPPGQDR